MILDPYKVREDFPILKRRINGHELVYLDNAATTQKPRQVIDAISDFYENHNANVHRAVHSLSQEATELYEKSRERIANFVNARDTAEIIFVRGTTEAINLVAHSWGLHKLSKDDEVLLTLMEHHSNIVPWEILSKIKGFSIKYADVSKDGTLNLQDFKEKISKKTRIVSLSHVSNVSGAINDIKKIARIAHEHGSLIFVDGAQSVPHMPVDVSDLDADFLAFSGHKMLGPTGIGVLYGKKSILEEMAPFQSGGDMIRDVSFNAPRGQCDVVLNDIPWKFEAGTPDISGGVGLEAAVVYLEEIGMTQVLKHETLLADYAIKRLSELEQVSVYSSHGRQNSCGIIPFNLKGLSSHDIAMMLDLYGIAVRSGFHCAQPLHQILKLKSSARASFYIYNTKEEVDRFIDTLKVISSCV